MADLKANKPSRQMAIHHRSRGAQVSIYFGKMLRMFVYQNDWKVLPMAALVAGLVGMVIRNKIFVNMEGTLMGAFAIVCVCIWNGCFNSIQVICRERDVVKREHRSGMHISSYIVSHMLYQCLLCLAQTAITLYVTLIVGVKYPPDGLVTPFFILDFMISMFLITYASDMLSLWVSALAKNTTTAMTIMPFLLVVQLVFAGGIFPLQSRGAQFISNFTLSNWGIKAVNVGADYNSQNSIILTQAIQTMSDPTDEVMGKIHDVLALPELKEKLETWTAQKLQNPLFAHTVPNLLKCWGILLLFTAIYTLIGLIFLEFIDRDKR